MVILQKTAICILLLLTLASAASSSPNWYQDTSIQTGHATFIISSQPAATIYYIQTLHHPINNNMKVILALKGIEQSTGPLVGFRPLIYSTSSTQFRSSLQIYGQSIGYLQFMYIVMQGYNSNFILTSRIKTCLVWDPWQICEDVYRQSKSTTFTEINQPNQYYDNWNITVAKTILFLNGYKIDPKTTGINLQIAYDNSPGNYHNITVKTKGDSIVYEVCYSRFTFYKDYITNSGYVFIDVANVNGTLETANIFGNLGVPGFNYRNFFVGINKISSQSASPMNILINLSPTSLTPINFIPANSTIPISTSSYQRTTINAAIFSKRQAMCNPSQPLLLDDGSLCYDNCPNNYYVQGPTCINSTTRDTTTNGICGNGVKDSIPGMAAEECDDGNTNSLDGCSSECKIECGYFCMDQYSSHNVLRNKCYFKGYYQILSVLRLIDSNRFALVLRYSNNGNNNCSQNTFYKKLQALKQVKLLSEIETEHRLLSQAPILSLIKTNQKAYQQMFNTDLIASLVLQYNQSISLKNKYLGLFQDYYRYNHYSSEKLQQPYNGVSLNYYPQSEYDKLAFLPYILLLVICLNMAYLLLMIVLRKAAIAVQSILVMQFAYFCIAAQTEVELSFAFLSFFGNFSTGLSINFFNGLVSEYLVCNQASKIWLDCNGIVTFGITGILASILFFVIMGSLIHRYRKTRSIQQPNESTQQNSLKVDNSFTQQKENFLPNETEPDNQSMAPSTAASSSNSTMLAYFSPNTSLFLSLCLQFTMSTFFITAIAFFLVAKNQNFFGFALPSMIWVAFYGMFNVAFWVIWFCFYPLDGLECSFVGLVRVSKQKYSVYKFFYPILFFFLNIFGLLIAFAPAAVTYGSLAAWCVFWLALIHFKNVYKSFVNKIRSMVNQVLVLSVLPVYFFLEYSENDGIASNCAYVISTILIVSLVWNVTTGIYFVCSEKKSQKDVKDGEREAMQVLAVELKNFATIGRGQQREIEVVSIEANKDRSKYGLVQFETAYPKRDLLVDTSSNKESIRSRTNDLRNFKNQIKLKKDKSTSKSNNNEVKIEIYNTLHREQEEEKETQIDKVSIQ